MSRPIVYAVAVLLGIRLTPVHTGPAAAPGGSACPQPVATHFSIDADIPAQKLALQRFFSEVIPPAWKEP